MIRNGHWKYYLLNQKYIALCNVFQTLTFDVFCIPKEGGRLVEKLANRSLGHEKSNNVEIILHLNSISNTTVMPEFITEPYTMQLLNFKVQMLLCNGRINFLDC